MAAEALTSPEKGKTAPILFFVLIPLSPSGREGSGE